MPARVPAALLEVDLSEERVGALYSGAKAYARVRRIIGLGRALDIGARATRVRKRTRPVLKERRSIVERGVKVGPVE